MNKEIQQKIIDAYLVLVGVGAEFEAKRYFLDEKAKTALSVLLDVLTGKNYFILTTCTNDALKDIGFKTERMVAPCGTLCKKQCECCENSIADLTKEDISLLHHNYRHIHCLTPWVCHKRDTPKNTAFRLL